MSIDSRHLGFALPSFDVVVDAERVKHFNLAIGVPEQTPVPPTFMKVLEGEQQSSRRIVTALGIDLRRLLHAEQQFDYHQPLQVGETLSIRRTVKGIQHNERRAMTFVVVESVATRDDGSLTCVSRQMLMVRDAPTQVSQS